MKLDQLLIQTKKVSKLIGVKYIEINTKWAGLGSTN